MAAVFADAFNLAFPLLKGALAIQRKIEQLVVMIVDARTEKPRFLHNDRFCNDSRRARIDAFLNSCSAAGPWTCCDD